MVSYFVHSIFSSSWKMGGDRGETKQCTLDMLNSEANFRTGQKFKRRRERERERERLCVCCAQEEEEEEEETLVPVESCGCVPISRLCLQQLECGGLL